MDAEQRELFRLARAGDATARNTLVVKHMGLVASSAKYFAGKNPHVGIEDLMQAGRIGLMRSVPKFDPDQGWAFSTYAMYWIKNEVRNLVHHYHARGTSALKKDSAAYVEGRMTPEDEAHYEASCLRWVPLDEKAASDGDLIRDLIPSEEEPIDEQVERSESVAELRQAILEAPLTRRERYALVHHYQVMDVQFMSAKEIAAHLGVATSSVASIVDRAVLKLREHMTDD